jgi:hypothetical protein
LRFTLLLYLWRLIVISINIVKRLQYDDSNQLENFSAAGFILFFFKYWEIEFVLNFLFCICYKSNRYAFWINNWNRGIISVIVYFLLIFNATTNALLATCQVPTPLPPPYGDTEQTVYFLFLWDSRLSRDACNFFWIRRILLSLIFFL